jgi:hypothetical protein
MSRFPEQYYEDLNRNFPVRFFARIGLDPPSQYGRQLTERLEHA